MDIFSRDHETKKRINQTAPEKQDKLMNTIVDTLLETRGLMEKRFSGWNYIQDEIARKNMSIEFRRAGSIRFDLFNKSFGSEKAVDIKLSTDLIQLKDIYDIAIILSGDQDYTPAVGAIKDLGKRTVNVAFLTEKGSLLPGGAKRLNQATDWSITLKYQELKSYLKIT